MDDQIMSYQVNRIKTQETDTRKRTFNTHQVIQLYQEILTFYRLME